jgi:hypothetical protein
MSTLWIPSSSWVPIKSGPSFLALFFILFLVFGIGIGLFRHFIKDADYIQYVALAGLIGMGCMRIYYSVTNGRYKFQLLILGMIVAFAFFFLTKTRKRKQRSSKFVSDSGGMIMPRYWGIFCVCTLVLAVYFFTPVFRILGVANLVVGAVIISLLIAFFAGGCGAGGCGGGGCGGGCGGGGCGG